MDQAPSMTGYLPWWGYAIGLFVILLILKQLFFGTRGGKRRTRGLGVGSLFLMLLFTLVAVLIFSLTLNFFTYHRLTYEQEIATVDVKQLAPQLFEVSITTPDEPHYIQTFELKGDQWQMDAQVLKWRGWAQVLGFNALYRLDRISGRYQDIEQARENLPSVYSIKENDGLDLWRYADQYPDKLSFIDASYGSATYLPLNDGEKYVVSLSQTGLLARLVE